ncbi:MAG: hypothetical protein ACI8RZ_004797 [Myxococcota bacterium]|jgi:hypothetical protein
MPLFGAGSALLIAPQSAWGTPNITEADMRPFNIIDVDYNQKPTRNESASISPTQGFTQGYREGTIAADGSFKIEVPYEGAGILWDALLGNSATGSIVSGIYPHTYTPDTSLAILTLVKMTGEAYEEVIQGAKIAKATFSYAVNQGLQCGFSFIAEKSPTGRVTPRTIAWTVPNPPIVEFGEIAASFTWASITTICPIKIDIEIDNAIEARFCVLSKYTMEPNFSGGKRMVKVSVEFDLEDMDAYNAYIAATEGDLSFIWTDGTNTFTINIDDAELLTYSDPISGDGRISVKATWGGKAKTSSDKAVTIIANNAQPTATEKA